jgi:hypothetical protein
MKIDQPPSSKTMNQNLSDLLRKKKAESTKTGAIDWDDRRKRYLLAVADLYRQIETIFSEPIADRTISIVRRPKNLTETYLGTYSVDDLLLLIGDEQVLFSPRGRNIVGADGRVDVVGERDEAALVHLPDSGWNVLQSRQPRVTMAPFDEAALADLLTQVTRDR